jgi:hypothetical protein
LQGRVSDPPFFCAVEDDVIVLQPEDSGEQTDLFLFHVYRTEVYALKKIKHPGSTRLCASTVWP